MIILRDIVVLVVLYLSGGQAAQPALTCDGALVQGGLVVCKASPGAAISTPSGVVIADADGVATFGLQRDAPKEIQVAASTPDGVVAIQLEVSPRRDETTIVSGISCDKIDARTDEQKAHAARSWRKKQEAWATIKAGGGPLDGFVRPAEGRISSPFGFVRRYVTVGCPEKINPHLGYDIAAPTGDRIVAPAGGVVILAEDDLYYEGGTVFLDHGHGLVSIFLHMSAVDVALGDEIAIGEKIGEIGATGRVTGAHLHWGVKWRNPSTDDRSGDFYVDPALLLEFFPGADPAKAAAREG